MMLDANWVGGLRNYNKKRALCFGCLDDNYGVRKKFATRNNPVTGFPYT
jgi:hypothetical protein